MIKHAKPRPAKQKPQRQSSPQPLVSVIVPTKNSAEFLDACLQSIQAQSYNNIELIVVDNNSTDNTKTIAKKYTPHVYNKGPERSAQRNYAATKASGKYIVFIDSDMQLQSEVIAECVITSNDKSRATIIPEQSFGEGFWAKCKQLERSFYVGQDTIEAARFFSKDLFNLVGGYNTMMVSGEDWDLSARARLHTSIGRTRSYILHNEGHLSLVRTLHKKYYYAGLAHAYISTNISGSKLASRQGPLYRYKLFFSRPTKLLRNPILGLGMLFMKTSEFAAGAAGYYRKHLGKA